MDINSTQDSDFVPGDAPVFETVVNLSDSAPDTPVSFTDFTDDNSVNQDDDSQKPDDAVEPSKPDDSQSVQTDDLNDYSDVAIWFKNLQKKGDFPEDIEVPKDATYELMEQAHLDYMNSNINSIRDQYISQLQDTGSYVEFLLNGGDPQVLQQVGSFKQFINADIDDKENQDQLVRAHLYHKGIPEDDINELIEKYKSSEKLQSKSAEAQEYFRTQEQYLIKADEDRRKAEQETYQNQVREYQNEVGRIISSGKLMDFDISKKEQLDLQKAMFEPSEVIQVRDQQGQIRRMQVTKLQAAQYELENNLEKQILLAKLILDGLDLSMVQQKTKNQADDDLIAVLNNRTSNRQNPTSKANTSNGWIRE